MTRFASGPALVPRGGLLRRWLAGATFAAPIFFIGGGIVGAEVTKWILLDRPGVQIHAEIQQREIEYQRAAAAVRHGKRKMRTK